MNRLSRPSVVACMTRYLRVGAAALFTAIAVAACGSEEPSSSPPQAPPISDTGGYTTPAETTGGAEETTGGGNGAPTTATITIENFGYGEPQTVAPGAKITVVNKDSAGHDVVADDAAAGFRTPVLQQDETAEITAPSTPGTYKYSCSLHGNMTSIGTLVVQG